MLDAATVVDQALDCDDEARGQELDHWQSPHGDSTHSLTPLEEAAVGETEITMTYARSSTAEMHGARSRTGVRSMRALIRSDVKGGTMIIVVPITRNLTGNAVPREGTMREESRPFPTI
jgi:hypothetical protein